MARTCAARLTWVEVPADPGVVIEAEVLTDAIETDVVSLVPSSKVAVMLTDGDADCGVQLIDAVVPRWPPTVSVPI